MGFEYGFSWEDPRNFVLWEAQFGDFANQAQVTIDQFVISGEGTRSYLCLSLSLPAFL
jgi:2-oxoglutarate dehydrogenase complex dehydrogenase (E1) component-like enzyme